MDWDDILRDNAKSESLSISPELRLSPRQRAALSSEQFELEQAMISKKDEKNCYSVEREYVNSKKYHDKFERLPVNTTVQQALYIQAGRLLEKVDGQEQERLLAIDARTGEFLVDNFEREGSKYGTGFTEEEYQKIANCPDFVVVMHNHSLNGRPSAQDLMTYLHDEHVRLSLVLCHDGTIYSIMAVKPETEMIYNDLLQEEKTKTTDIDEAKQFATTRLYNMNKKLDAKHKLFTIAKLQKGVEWL